MSGSGNASTGTSVGVITLDLRIVSKINEQLDAIAANANRSAQRSFEKVGKTVEQSVTKPAEKAGKALEKAITAPVENAQKTVQDTLKKTQEQTEDTVSQINEILSRQQQEAHEALQNKVKLPEVAPREPSATASEIFRQKGKDVETGHAANAPPDLSDTFMPAADGAELLHQKMANIQIQFDAEREKLAALNAEFAKLEVGTKAWDDLSAKITTAEGRLISLQSTMNAAQAKIDEPARKAAAAAEKAAAAQERAAQRAAAAQERAAQRAAAAAERAAAREQAAQSRVSASASKSGKASMWTVRNQANTVLSAVTSSSKGLAQLGLMGRALITSLTGSLAIAGPLAIAAAAFGVLRKSISLATINSDQFKRSLNEVKANLQIAFTPIYQAILPALNALMAGLAAVTRYIATFISALFGKTYAQSLAATKQMQKNAAAAEKAKKSGSSGAKDKNQGSLAGFDELNVIGKKDKASSDGSDSPDGINYDALSTKGSAAAAGLAEKFKAAWASIAAGFNDYVVKPVQDNLYKFDEPIAKFKALFADIGAQCLVWLQPLSQWFQTDFKSALAQGIGDATTILAGLMDSLAMVATTIWKALQPAIDWIIRNGLPLLTDMFKECSKTAVTAFGAIKTVFDTLWHGVVDPFAQFLSKVIVDILNTFKDLWDRYGATTFENIRTAINNTRDLFLTVWNSFLKPVFDQIFLTLNQLWTDHLQPLIGQIGEFVAKLVNGALEIYNGFIAPVVGWLVKTFGPAFAQVFNTAIQIIGLVVGSIADAAKNIFKALGGVIDFLTGVFTGNWSKAWNGVKEIFSGVFGALYSIAKGPINGIIGLLNGLISGINAVVKELNKIHVDIPDWVPKFGGKSFGIHLGTIRDIPYLANGGVLEQPTLAMMGEYSGARNNPEIAAPQTVLMDTFMQAIVPMLNELEEFRENIVALLHEIIAKNPNIVLDGTTLARLLKPYLDEENRRVGGTIF